MMKHNRRTVPSVLVALCLYASAPVAVEPFSIRDRFHKIRRDESLPQLQLSKRELSSETDDSIEPRVLQIAFVTGNAMKADEVNRILADHGVTKSNTDKPSLVNLKILNVDLPEIQEVDTFAIAKDKALLGSQLANMPCLVEDTSLGFTALGGMPGPYIKWFQDRLKSEGLYNILQAYEDKSATAVCTLAFCPAPHADPVLFTGECHGTIVPPDPGRGFGWDSIFVADECKDAKPFSQLMVDEKCRLSHRGKAVRKWADWLGRNEQVLWERQQGTNMLGHKGLNFRSDYPEQ